MGKLSNLITKADITANCRACYAEDDLVNNCIKEAQNIDIKNDFGNELFLRLYEQPQADEIKLLWEGGSYTSLCGGTAQFEGLKTTLCYYAFSRILRNSGANVTRFGVVEKQDDYSANIEHKKRLQQANEILSVADSYKLECLNFIKNSGLFDTCTPVKIVNRRLRVRKIGH